MGRKRKSENKHLPQGWIFKHGAYYYKPAPKLRPLWGNKTMFQLGKTLAQAHLTFSKRINLVESNITTIGQLLDRFAFEVVPTFAPTTQRAVRSYIKALRAVFADFPLLSLTPQHVYQYQDKRTAKVSGKNEVATLSSAYSYAVRWGLIPSHPFKGEVEIRGVKKAGTRYVTDADIDLILNLESSPKSVAVIQAYISLKLLIGCRKSDILRIKITDWDDNELRVYNNKSDKPMVFIMVPELKAALERCKSVRPVLSPYLLCTRRGECMVTEEGRADSFDRAWNTARRKAKVDFTEQDIRRKVGSDQDTLERATEILGHADTKVTKRHYRAKAIPIKPSDVG
jgi:integrase